MQLIATCAFGLEKIVARELEALGYVAHIPAPGRIFFTGDATAICRANLWLRTADRVLVRMAQFPATDFGQLFDATRAVDWHDWIVPDGEFPVAGRSIKSQLSSVPACQRIVKKAIVESLRAGHGVETLEETGPKYQIEVALLKDEVTLTLDTTGPSLHKRGYRKLSVRAPIKETLAAAMVQLSYWRHDRPLIDPFCGSGTIPIEAAMIGRNLAPGLHRQFSAENWPGIAAVAWTRAREEARDLAKPDLSVRIMGTDIDAEALDMARYHAKRAGVTEQVHFQERAFDQLFSKQEYGCVITNPPYGERLDEYSDIEPLYRTFPEILRRLPTWSHYVLTPHPTFEKLIEKKADRRRKLYNARIECTLYQFHGPKPTQRRAETAAANTESPAPVVPAVTDVPTATETFSAPITESETVSAIESVATTETATPDTLAAATPPASATVAPATAAPAVAKTETPAPAFGGLTAKMREQGELLRSRLTKRARHLRRWPTRRGITCYRLYERDIPEVPLVVDLYEDHLHITEYERPHERDLGQHAEWLELMARTAGQVFDIDRNRVFLKQRNRQRGSQQYEHLDDEKYELFVHEGGLKFLVNLSDYVDTGLFLDHRITRGMVRDAAEGKRFLNLFAYTGAFSVYAAAGGAEHTTTVDWSRTYLEWAQRNMVANELGGSRNEFIRSDALEFLDQQAENEGQAASPSESQGDTQGQYDLAVVDPPTFSNSKRTERDWEIQRDYIPLFAKLLPLMSPGGVIYFSTNFRRFKLDEAALPDCQVREISKQTVPEDFRNQRIHRCWRIVKSEG